MKNTQLFQAKNKIICYFYVLLTKVTQEIKELITCIKILDKHTNLNTILNQLIRTLFFAFQLLPFIKFLFINTA